MVMLTEIKMTSIMREYPYLLEHKLSQRIVLNTRIRALKPHTAKYVFSFMNSIGLQYPLVKYPILGHDPSTGTYLLWESSLLPETCLCLTINRPYGNTLTYSSVTTKENISLTVKNIDLKVLTPSFRHIPFLESFKFFTSKTFHDPLGCLAEVELKSRGQRFFDFFHETSKRMKSNLGFLSMKVPSHEPLSYLTNFLKGKVASKTKYAFSEGMNFKRSVEG